MKTVNRHSRAGRWPVKQTSWLKGRQVGGETDIQLGRQIGRQAKKKTNTGILASRQEGRQANV